MIGLMSDRSDVYRKPRSLSIDRATSGPTFPNETAVTLMWYCESAVGSRHRTTWHGPGRCVPGPGQSSTRGLHLLAEQVRDLPAACHSSWLYATLPATCHPQGVENSVHGARCIRLAWADLVAGRVRTSSTLQYAIEADEEGS